LVGGRPSLRASLLGVHQLLFLLQSDIGLLDIDVRVRPLTSIPACGRQPREFPLGIVDLVLEGAVLLVSLAWII